MESVLRTAASRFDIYKILDQLLRLLEIKSVVCCFQIFYMLIFLLVVQVVEAKIQQFVLPKYKHDQIRGC